MSVSNQTPDIDHSQVANAINKPATNGDTVYHALHSAWGLPEVPIGDGLSGTPVTRFARRLWESHQDAGPNDETKAEELYGTRHPFLAGALVGDEYEADGSVADFDRVLDHDSGQQRGIIDNNVVQSASPVVVDPEIFSILRSQAPVLDVIPTVSQDGFTAQYNVFDSRTLSDFFMSESDAMDFTSGNTASDFALETETDDMQIMATYVDVGDFSQRAEQSLDYMNLMDTTVGQVMQEWFLTKAAAYLYGDSSASGAIYENSDGFDGLAKIASDASNVNDKTGVTSGRLEDLLDFVTARTQDSSLTFGNARVLCSPAFYNAIYDEVTPVVRLGGYDADVEFGPQGLAIGHERGTVPITPVDGIRDRSSSAGGVGSNSTDGDVFLYDERAVQFRALAPDSTVPLGRVGLADRSALFSYGTIIDKTFESTTPNSNTHRLRYGDV